MSAAVLLLFTLLAAPTLQAKDIPAAAAEKSAAGPAAPKSGPAQKINNPASPEKAAAFPLIVKAGISNLVPLSLVRNFRTGLTRSGISGFRLVGKRRRLSCVQEK